MITIKKGLDLPISGAPRQEISDGQPVSTVALVGYDYNGMKPTMLVKEGDRVKLGQPVFTDKKNEGVIYTAPASGLVKAINRGARRLFQSLVIELDSDDHEQFEATPADQFNSLSAEALRETLVKSGAWTAFRTRPYSKVPAINSEPAAIFVQAMDTNPLAADPATIIGTDSEAFTQGLSLLTKLTQGKSGCARRRVARFRRPRVYLSRNSAVFTLPAMPVPISIFWSPCTPARWSGPSATRTLSPWLN